MSARSALLGWLLLLCVALGLRLAPIDHGAPRNYVPDTHMVRSALGMAKDKDLVPPVGKYSTYPNLMPYALLPIYAAQYAAGRASGAWGGAGEYGNHLAEHPHHAQIPARVLVALAGAASVWVVFRWARAAGLRHGAWIAAWLVGTSLLHVQFSTHERPWVPLVLFLCLAGWQASAYVAEPTRKRLAWCGVWCGCAFATHQAGLPLLGLAALAWVFAPRGWKAGQLGARLVDGLLCVALAAALGLLGHAYLLVHGATPEGAVSGAEALEALDRQGSGISFGIGGQAIHIALRWASLERLSLALLGYDPALLLLGLAGAWVAWQRSALRAALLFAVGWGAFFMTNQNDHVRYLLPLVPFLALAAGAGVERWLEGARGITRALLTLALVLPLVQALRFDWLLAQPDTRALAEERLELEQHPLVAIDRHGPALDLDLASLERLAELRELYGREQHRRELLVAGVATAGGAGLAALPLEDVVLVDERQRRVELRPAAKALAADARGLLERFGVSHVLVAERRRTEWEPLDEALPLGSVLWTIDPGPAARECFLPTEMDFPLTALWQVERPGPRLALRVLSP